MNALGNFQFNTSSIGKVSPYERLSGLKLAAKRDLRGGFGENAVATKAFTDSFMYPRADKQVALGAKGGPTGSVYMLSLPTSQVVTRDQFVL